MSSTQLKVTVLGSGTSAGVPVVACDCAVCTSDDPLNRRLRSSILLQGPGRSILVDCGSDFRQQALTNCIKRLDCVLLTHAHSDHVSGMDEIRLFNWKQGHAIPVYCSPQTAGELRRRFEYIFVPPEQVGGGIPQIDLVLIDGSFEVLGLTVLPVEVLHGSLPVLGFRFGEFAYVTDASHVPPEAMRRLAGVRYLILNALRYRPHPTHLSIDEAVAIAEEIGPEKTWFTHITHDLDHREVNAKLPSGIQLAHDGLTFDVDAGAAMPSVEDEGSLHR